MSKNNFKAESILKSSYYTKKKLTTNTDTLLRTVYNPKKNIYSKH